ESDLATPPDDLSARLPEYGETLRPTWVARGGKGQPEHLILIEELPWGTDFDKAVQQSEEHRWHASPQARFERLLRETGVSIGLLVSPGQIRLVYAPKGESSGHITFPIHQMTMAANWPMPAALHLLLHNDRLFIGPEIQRLPAILEASRRHQNYSISGLYERLRADAGQYPDTMDSRYGAWAQIITLPRLLYAGGGHGSWRLPPRHGGLFDPDAFPFLEGRAWESKRESVRIE